MHSKPNRKTFRSRLDEMVQTLREDIATGRRAHGDFLPSETDLGEQFQLSKMSVRKGLQRLVEERLIEKIPNVGTRITGFKPRESVTIKFGHYPLLNRTTDLFRLIERFESDHPHIRVELIPMPYYHDRPNLRDYMERGTVDLALVNYSDFELFLDGDPGRWLQPLAPDARTYSAVQRPFMRSGCLYAYPFVFSPVILCYNREHFREAEAALPSEQWTWDELLQAAHRLTLAHTRYGFYFFPHPFNRVPALLLQSGFIFPQTPQEGHLVDDGRLRSCLELTRALVHAFPAYLSHQGEDAESLFRQQKVSMIITTYFNLNALRDVPFEYDITPLPSLNTADALLLAMGIAINRETPHPREAELLLRHLVSEETQLHIRRQTSSIPGLISAAEHPVSPERPERFRYDLYCDLLAHLRPYTDTGLTHRQLAMLHEELKLVWAGLDSLDAALNRFETALYPNEAKQP